MPYWSSAAFKTGTIALVVHDAAERIWSSGWISPSLMPATMFLMSPLPGAVRITFATPLAFR